MTIGCKKRPLAVLSLATVTAVGAQPVADPVLALRDCVRDATSPVEVVACESQASGALRQRINDLEAAIFVELDRQQRLLFQRNIDAWKNFVAAESEMAEFAFGARRDGLGPQLQLGESNRLLEQRFDQLRAYLSSLKRKGTLNDRGSRTARGDAERADRAE